MNELLSTWAISVTVAIIFSAMISTLLPETAIKKYIKVVLGIVVTIIILSPLFSLKNGTDVRQEMSDALGQVQQMSEHAQQSTRYTDYILDVYEVYIGDE